MFRALAVTLGLALTAPALACGGGAPCAGACAMKHDTDPAADFAKVDAAEGTKATFTVTGMRCGACSKKVVAALTALEGVTVAAVSHETGEAKVAFDSATATTAKMIEAIQGLGFEVEVKAAS